MSAGSPPPRHRGRSFMTWATCQVRVTTSPMRPIALRVRGGDRERAEVVQDVLRGDRGRADPGFGEREILRDGGFQVVADHEHVEMLGDGVHGVRQCRVRRARDDVRQAREREDVGSVAAAGALDVKRVDRAARDRPDGRVDVPGLVERVGVERDLSPHSSAARSAASMAAGVDPQSSWTL